MFECLHCGRPHNVRGKRGLCQGCYHKPGIRERYPSKTNRHLFREPTMEELNALEAANRPTMPTRGPDDE